MSRYLIAFVVLVVYIGGSVWLVRHEGSAYRATLRRDRGVARDDTEPRPAPPVPPEGEPEATQSAPAVVSQPEATASPAVADARAEVAKPDGTSTPPESLPPAQVQTAPIPAQATPSANPLWDSPLMKRVWDVADMRTEDETMLGQALHELILSTNRKVEVGPMPRLVEETAEPFVAARKRKEIDYTFTVLDSDAVNAFSHPGGYVYVTSGLMNWIGEDQRYALEFLLAHEIAHVDLRHALTCLNDPGVKELGLGTLQQFVVLILPLGYAPDRLDFEADRWANQQMLQLNRSKRERLAFLRKLEGYARDQGFENGRVLPKPSAEAAPLENHLRAHPAPYKRLKQFEAVTAPAPARAP
jgi:hypothetical protein